MLCFLEGKIIPAISLLDKHLRFNLKKQKELFLACVESCRNYMEL